MTCPFLHPGIHFQETDRWPVRICRPVGTPLPRQIPDMDLISGSQILATIRGSFFMVQPDYACDGYTPVLRFGRRRFLRLTPTPRCGLFPSVLHDALRQFLTVPGCAWTREDSDNWFFHAMVAGGTHPHHAGIYRSAVAGPVGTAWITLTRKTDPRLRIVPA